MRYLDTFLSQFRNGFQRGARFECQLYPNQTFLQSILTGSLLGTVIGTVLPTVGQQLNSDFSLPAVVQWLARGLVVTNASLPSRALETTPHIMYGISEEFPYSTEYTDLQCTFLMPLNASDCPMPRFFNYWQNYIQRNQNGPQDGLDFRYPEDYYGTMLISTFDNSTNRSLTYQFEKVYPKTVMSSPVAWDQHHEFLAFNVSFVYSYWKILPFKPPPLIEVTVEL